MSGLHGPRYFTGPKKTLLRCKPEIKYRPAVAGARLHRFTPISPARGLHSGNGAAGASSGNEAAQSGQRASHIHKNPNCILAPPLSPLNGFFFSGPLNASRDPFVSRSTFRVFGDRSTRCFSSTSREPPSGAPPVTILYGTHTGGSKLHAERLDQELKWRLNLKTQLAACDEVDPSSLDTAQLLILFMTSYGQGGPPKNAERFYRRVMTGANEFSKLMFTVFGRGSSAYVTFNEAGIAMDRQLAALGAKRFAPYAQSDDLAFDNEETYFEWKEKVVRNLIAQYNLEEHPLVYEPRAQLKESPKDAQWTPKPKEMLASLEITNNQRSPPEFAPVTRKLHTDSFGRTFIHSTFDLDRTAQIYETGDYLAVWPTNDANEVQTFLNALGLQGSQIVTVDNKWRSTYELLARHFVDINSQPSREALKYFVSFAPSAEARQKLDDLCESSAQFQEFSKKHFNVGRILLACSNGEPWSKVPPTLILDILPQLQPRDYSISSSPLADSTQVSIGLVVENGPEWKGVASNYLLEVEDGIPIPVCTEMSEFKLPEDPTAPVIMVGIGTGLSPYRGFVQERKELAAAGIPLGPAMLFAGCKNQSAFQYHDFFHELPHLEVYPAYSQVEDKKYVQDALREHSERIYDLVNQGAYFYICGSARLLKKHVRRALTEIIAQNAGISYDAANLQVKVLKRERRFQQDVW